MKKILWILVIVIGLVVVAGLTIKKGIDYLYPLTYFDLIQKSAEKYDVDPYLIAAIIRNESRFNKNAKSKVEAKGLMQVMDTTAKDVVKEIDYTDFEIEHLYDPEVNIEIGTKYISNLLKQFDQNELLAVASYNAGFSKVKSWLKDGIITQTNVDAIPYKETNSYVRKVMRDYRIYKKIYEH